MPFIIEKWNPRMPTSERVVIVCVDEVMHTKGELTAAWSRR